MKRKFSILLVGVVAATAALLSVHPAEAAPVQAAVALAPNQLEVYRDANYLNILNRYDILADCDTAGYNFHFYSTSAAYWSMSSVKYRWGGSGAGGNQSHCNVIWLGTARAPYVWYGECINAYGGPEAAGIHYFGSYGGAYFNDNVGWVQLKYEPGCPLFTTRP